jgi:AraC-like DNA-binding protein
MRLTVLSVHPRLAGLVEQLWYFESAVGLPAADRRLVVPNGAAKLIVPLENALVVEGTTGAPPDVRGEAAVHAVGVSERPVRIASAPRATRTLGVTLAPGAGYRLLGVPASELRERILSLSELWGADGHALGERLAGPEAVAAKADALQTALVGRLDRQLAVRPGGRDGAANGAAVVDYAVGALRATRGRLDVASLAERTGYTVRHLHALCVRHVGLSPKRLASVLRFQHFYGLWAAARTQAEAGRFYHDALHGAYHDQAHFIREFRRYAGLPPARFAAEANEFGRLFHREAPESGAAHVR